MSSVADKCATFRRLHESGCFVIPNPWDAGSARYLQSTGFKAIASSSAGFAWTIARRDNKAALDEVLAHLRTLSAAVDIPVNADFEDGYASAPEDVAVNVRRALETGIAGLSIEDSTRNSQEPLYDFSLAVERIKAARRAIDAAGTGVMLTARSEGYIAGRPDRPETIKRLVAFAEAGADCLFAPGIRAPADIEAAVKAVAPKPVNVVISKGGLSVSELAALGVRRISTGGSLARVAWSAFMAAAKQISENGRFDAFDQAASSADINTIFGA